MEQPSAIQLQRNHLRTSIEDEIVSSDDSEVSVANMNRHEDNPVPAIDEESEEKSCSTNVNDENEIPSDDDYSDDSIRSKDFFVESDVTKVSREESDMTNVTARSSMSLDYSGARGVRRIERGESTPPGPRFDGDRETFLRMCTSANDNRFTINNEPRVRNRRRNMSFTNAEMQRIDRENQFLLKKIMAQQKLPNKPTRVQSAQPRISSSAINRRKLQKRIEEENMMLLRRIQGAKPCALSTNATPGYRVTSL